MSKIKLLEHLTLQRHKKKLNTHCKYNQKLEMFHMKNSPVTEKEKKNN